MVKQLLLAALLPIGTVLPGFGSPVQSVSTFADAAPRINGPNIFGVRPGSPLLYTIPVTGERPIRFSADNIPKGVTMDRATGRITGTLRKMGEYRIVLHAVNSKGAAEKVFRIEVGDRIALTPPMGWNSWNCWGDSVDSDKILAAAKAMVSSGLINHGWTYINIDDGWQGKRTGKDGALQGNKKFPDMKALCDAIHRMGLKVGIYSTPWITSYAGYPGGSSDAPDGVWSSADSGSAGRHFGKYSFARADADQWSAWGIDYLKYDWNPIDLPHVIEMSKALRQSGRDIVFSLSNAALFDHVKDWARWANSWRTTGDIWDYWDQSDEFWRYSVSAIAFSQDQWAPYAGPGHWNDPDMLVVGWVGWGPKQHLTHLTHSEQRAHVSMWCMLSAPLLIGCNLERLDSFTLGLLGNDEVLALDQDALGEQAVRVATVGAVDVYLKHLEDGSRALGFFNRGDSVRTVSFNKLARLGFHGPQRVRDLWRHVDLPPIRDLTKDDLVMTIPAHGVQLYRLWPVK